MLIVSLANIDLSLCDYSLATRKCVLLNKKCTRIGLLMFKVWT